MSQHTIDENVIVIVIFGIVFHFNLGKIKQYSHTSIKTLFQFLRFLFNLLSTIKFHITNLCGIAMSFVDRKVAKFKSLQVLIY